MTNQVDNKCYVWYANELNVRFKVLEVNPSWSLGDVFDRF